jgi:hypothetical protein
LDDLTVEWRYDLGQIEVYREVNMGCSIVWQGGRIYLWILNLHSGLFIEWLVVGLA